MKHSRHAKINDRQAERAYGKLMRQVDRLAGPDPELWGAAADELVKLGRPAVFPVLKRIYDGASSDASLRLAGVMRRLAVAVPDIEEIIQFG